MSELAARWSELTLADLPVGGVAARAARESGSLLRPAATEDEILAVEARIGRRLPPSYREFLLVSDGAYGDVYGARLGNRNGWEAAYPESPTSGVGFLPCADVLWLRDAKPELAEIYDMDEPGSPVRTDGEETWPWTPMAGGLEIGINHEPGETCLVPFDGVEEWQVWNIHFETCTGYVSFRSMLEHEVARLEPVTSLAEVRDLIARARAGDLTAPGRLSRTTVPEAFPLLLDLVGTSLESTAAMALGRIGTAEAVEVIARLPVESGAAAALVLAGTEQARDVLVEWGRYWDLTLLGDARGAEIAARELPSRDAIWALTYARDPRFADAIRAVPIDGSEELALDVAKALASLGLPEGRRRLTELTDAAWPVGAYAEHSLAMLDDGFLPD